MALHIIERPAHQSNWSRRPAGVRIDAIIIHDTGGKTAESALRWFEDPGAGVSSHYVVDPNGTIYRPVAEEDKAWHAGVSSLWGETDLNQRSIGIEIVDENDSEPYPGSQWRCVIELTAEIARRRAIWLNRIVGHQHIAVPQGRKKDPGRDFMWHPFLLAVSEAINAER